MPQASGSDAVKNGRWSDCTATNRNADFLKVVAKTTITSNQAYCYFSKYGSDTVSQSVPRRSTCPWHPSKCENAQKDQDVECV